MKKRLLDVLVGIFLLLAFWVPRKRTLRGDERRISI